MGLAATGNEAPVISRADRIFFSGFALATTATAFLGFTFTYFTPMLTGSYPDLSPFVHIHGWSFFLWYLLFPMQAVLIAANRSKLHMAFGRASVALALLMIVTGVFVLAVRMDDALSGDADGFLAFLRYVGSLIFSNILLFAVFYALAIRMAMKGRFQAHKRWIVLASSAGLGAALFRVFGFLFGPVAWADTGWVMATNAFMVSAMVFDRLFHGKVHPVYWQGLAFAIAVEAMLWPFPGNPVVAQLNSSLAWIGDYVRVIY